MIIAIDHGNKQIKTLHHVFTSGYMESSTIPPFGEIMKFEGKYYGLSSERIPNMSDKTVDDKFFILTLFAIGKEIMSKVPNPEKEIHNIQLLVGLPPAHYGSMYKKFEAYFTKRDPKIYFELNKTSLGIHIQGAFASPQAYSASLLAYDSYCNVPRANIIDIGGYTTDCLLVEYGKANLTMCESIHKGVIHLFNESRSKLRSIYMRDVAESIIDGIVNADPLVLAQYNSDLVNIVHDVTDSFINKLLAALEEVGINFQEDTTIFVGGGSTLLKRYIKRTGKVSKPIFIDDVFANVKGYHLLWQAFQTTGK